MQHALALAERGWGAVAPNPMVGAVVVRDGEIVGEGHHAAFGGPHAEVQALAQAGERARGATLYVTLEPCAHHGKTPPCTDAIVRAGVGHVVYAAADPTQAGGGAEGLRARGIEVEGGVCERAARDLNAAFFIAATERRTFVALKLALSLDARIAEAPGRRTSVTGPRALRATHRLRAGHDAVAVGVGTVLADDPRLTVREWRAPAAPPARVVLDSGLRTPPDSRLVAEADTAPLWLFAAPDAPTERARALTARGVQVLTVAETRPGRLDLGAVLAELWRRDVRSLLVEGGADLASSLLTEDRVDRLHLFYAPFLLGPGGLPAFTDVDPRRWRLAARRGLGRDTWLTLARA